MEKNTSTVPKTGVFRYNGGQIRGPPPTSEYNNAVNCDGSRGFKGAPKLPPMMPTDASLSDSYKSHRCCLSSLELIHKPITLKIYKECNRNSEDV